MEQFCTHLLVVENDEAMSWSVETKGDGMIMVLQAPKVIGVAFPERHHGLGGSCVCEA